MTSPHRSVRTRLTLLYGGLFLLCGAVLLAINLGILGLRLPNDAPPTPRAGSSQNSGNQGNGQDGSESDRDRQRREDRDQIQQEVRDDTLRNAAVVSGIALIGMAGVSFALGWWVAGRVLRPIHDITGAARRASEENLDERIALDGPNDELKELADTFDSMLARLDTSFRGQKEFVANASHELRTPLALMRAEVDVVMDDPDANPDDYREALGAVRDGVVRAQDLIDRLLVLARAEGAVGSEQVDVAAVADDVLNDAVTDSAHGSIDVQRSLEPSVVLGDTALLRRLIGNLVENAVRYNRTGGWVRVSTSRHDGRVVLEVANSGDLVPSDRVTDLFNRFERGERSRDRRTGGFGLGLAIVSAVAAAHGGTVRAVAPDDGGLRITVSLPAALTTEPQPA